jgi:hypothetical protein
MALATASLLSLAGCTLSPPPPPPARASASLPPQRAALVQAALTEWQRWGKLTVDGWPEYLDPPAAPENFPSILAYWETVSEGPAVIRRHEETRDAMLAGLVEFLPEGTPLPLPAISLFASPAWSAAFVSYVMQRAGVPGYIFPPAAAHAFYIDALLYAWSGNPEGAAFVPHAPVDYTPRAGDLICADRSRSPLYHWQERLSEAGQFRPMHCDVVVAAGGGLVQAVGGNVLDAVVLRRFPADGAGRALPPPWDKAPFFVVFENRLDVTR